MIAAAIKKNGPHVRAVGEAQLRCVTRSLRDPEAFCLRRLAFFQDGLMRAFRAIATLLRFGAVVRFRIGGIGPLGTFALIVLGQGSVAGRRVGMNRVALRRRHDAGVQALLGEAFTVIVALAGHADQPPL